MPVGKNEATEYDDPRADIEAAFAAVEETDEGEASGEVEDTPEGLDTGAASEEEQDTQSSGTPDAGEGEADETPEPGEEPVAADTGTEEAEGSAGPGDSGDDGDTGRAPVSWSPAVREYWKDLPKEVKEQVAKREREVVQALGQSTAARRFAEEWSGMVRPFEPLIAAQQATPFQAVKRLLEIGAGLYTGTQANKAHIVSELIKQYEIDLRVLDETLAKGAPVNTEDSRIEQIVAQRMAPFNQIIQQNQQAAFQRQQAVRTEISTELGNFAKNAEFFEDVRLDMADLMDLASNRGRPMTIQQAYDQACQLHPEIGKIVKQRATALEAKKRKEEAEARRNAGSSIRGTQSGGSINVPTNDGPDDLRSDIERAFDSATPRSRARV